MNSLPGSYTTAIFGPVYVPGKVIPALSWTPQYPVWIDAPMAVIWSGAVSDAVSSPGLPSLVCAEVPIRSLAHPELWPSFFAPIDVPVVPVPTLWTVVAPVALVHPRPTFPASWVGPVAPPVAPLGWAALVPDALPLPRATQPVAWVGPHGLPPVSTVPTGWLAQGPYLWPLQVPAQPPAWVGPIALPTPPRGWAAVAPESLPHRRADQQSFWWAGFTPAPVTTTLGWLPDYPVQFFRPRAVDSPTVTGGAAPITPTYSWLPDAPGQFAPVTRPLSAFAFVPVVVVPVPPFWAPVYPSQIAAGRPTYSDPSVFSGFLTPTAGTVFRRTLQLRSGGRTEQLK
jgi:hypothetical protein